MAAESDIDAYVKEKFFKDQKTGVLVEVGAARPDYLSISEAYRGLAWTILAIEPNPKFCEEHRKRGYEILQYAVGDSDNDNVNFYIVDAKGASYAGGSMSFEGMSSLGPAEGIKTFFDNVEPEAAASETIQVKVRRLNTILAEHAPSVANIDLLTIDVEGWELPVLRGLDFSKYKPKVVVLENVFQSLAYEDAMIALGYERDAWLYPNEVYVARTSSLKRSRVARRAYLRVRDVLAWPVRRYRNHSRTSAN